MGIGAYQAREYVRLGGDVEVRASRQGTRFSLRLPLKPTPGCVPGHCATGASSIATAVNRRQAAALSSGLLQTLTRRRPAGARRST